MSNLDEKIEAKKDGAKLVRNSGRGYHKGDAWLDEFMIDYKHNARSFTLSKKAWKKLLKDAWGEDRRSPVIKIVFEPENGKEYKVAVIEWEWFADLLELKEKYERRENSSRS